MAALTTCYVCVLGNLIVDIILFGFKMCSVHVMQYKFYVDGEWRHDEQQQFLSGNYGVVNTIFLSGEPDMVPNVFPPEAPGRANMDVDNDVYMPVVRFFTALNWFISLLVFVVVASKSEHIPE